MSDEEMTFDKWSSMWDRLLHICKQKEDFRALIAHTVNYNTKWNEGK